MINQLNGSVTIYGFVGIVFQKLMEPEITLFQGILIFFYVFITRGGF